MDVLGVLPVREVATSGGVMTLETAKFLFQVLLTVAMAVVGGWVRGMKRTGEKTSADIHALTVQAGQVGQWIKDHTKSDEDHRRVCDEGHRRLREDVSEMNTTVQRVAAVQDLCNACQRRPARG